MIGRMEIYCIIDSEHYSTVLYSTFQCQDIKSRDISHIAYIILYDNYAEKYGGSRPSAKFGAMHGGQKSSMVPPGPRPSHNNE